MKIGVDPHYDSIAVKSYSHDDNASIAFFVAYIIMLNLYNNISIYVIIYSVIYRYII